MATPYFSPHAAIANPCWHCTEFTGMAYGASAATCSLPNGPRVRANPGYGCSAFQREVGADDEPGPPSGAGAQQVLAPVIVAPTTVRWAP